MRVRIKKTLRERAEQPVLLEPGENVTSETHLHVLLAMDYDLDPVNMTPAQLLVAPCHPLATKATDATVRRILR